MQQIIQFLDQFSLHMFIAATA